MKYRFRTEDEFIDAFGEDWRDTVITWDSCMDHLFGKSIADNLMLDLLYEDGLPVYLGSLPGVNFTLYQEMIVIRNKFDMLYDSEE